MNRYGQDDLDAILNFPDDPDPVAAGLARQIQEAGFANVQADPGGALCVIAYLSDEDAREFLRDLRRREARGAEDQTTTVDIWITLIIDRHSDVDSLPFSSEERAIAAARDAAPDGTEPAPLNNAMRKNGWVFYLPYGSEGDCVCVVRRTMTAGG